MPKPKSNKLKILLLILVFIIIAALAYFYLVPLIFKPKTTTPQKKTATISLEKINKTLEEIESKKDFGTPISDNEKVGRTNPFAPI